MSWDDFLDKHPRLSELHWWVRRNTVLRWDAFLSKRMLERYWPLGTTYLDHGYEPCVLVERDEYGGLTGVSMIDGRIVGGCSVFHCGPEPVSLKEARAVTAFLKKMHRHVTS